jgi:hypothetical protein
MLDWIPGTVSGHVTVSITRQHPTMVIIRVHLPRKHELACRVHLVDHRGALLRPAKRRKNHAG